MDSKKYTSAEEKFNFITHGLGIFLSLAGLVVFFFLGSTRGTTKDLAGLFVFGLSLTLLYSFSALYHFTKEPLRKQFFQKLDHSAIFILIAGSYTPLMIMTLKPSLGISIISINWVFAVVGIFSEFFSVFKTRKWTIVLYVIMGWMAVFVIKPLIENVSLVSLILIVVGGVVYTVGIIFYVKRTIYHNHGIWHLFVLAGSTCHYFAILNIFLSLARN